MHKQDIRGQVNAISPRTMGCHAPGFETMQTFHYLETEFPLLDSNLHHYVMKLMINAYGTAWILSRSVPIIWKHLKNYFLWVSIRSSGGRYRLMLNLSDFIVLKWIEITSCCSEWTEAKSLLVRYRDVLANETSDEFPKGCWGSIGLEISLDESKKFIYLVPVPICVQRRNCQK